MPGMRGLLCKSVARMRGRGPRQIRGQVSAERRFENPHPHSPGTRRLLADQRPHDPLRCPVVPRLYMAQYSPSLGLGTKGPLEGGEGVASVPSEAVTTFSTASRADLWPARAR